MWVIKGHGNHFSKIWQFSKTLVQSDASFKNKYAIFKSKNLFMLKNIILESVTMFKKNFNFGAFNKEKILLRNQSS